MKSFFYFSVFTLGSGVLAGYPRRVGPICKAVPGGPGWPSEADWEQLKKATKGRLLSPHPPAAPCHEKHAAFDADLCESVTRGFRDSTWHAENPLSNMWQNYNNYSCMPGGGGSCSNGGFPLYVVEAQEASDVKAAVDFARTHNIRLNIKSTGHDFLGRSVQPNSLSIWTHKLTTRQWFTDTFSPKNCNVKIPGPAVKVGAGSRWGTLGNEARSRNVMVVGGAFATVSAGGFLSNGGHGGLSAKYGLGADQVLEIELVTPMGEVIVANECQNQDYFWAMRGGGGSTYGVAVSYTIQAIPTVKTARSSGVLQGWDEITYFHRHWSKLAMIGGSGYFNGYPGRGGSVRWSVSVPNITREELREVLDPILEGMGKAPRLAKGSDEETAFPGGTNNAGLTGKGGRGKNNDENALEEKRKMKKRWVPPKDRVTYQEFATWGEAEKTLHDRSELSVFGGQATFPGMGQNKIIASWLWSEADNQHPNLKEAIMGAFDKDTQMLNDATMGVGTHKPPFIRGGGNAVNPAFRTAVMRPASELQWSGTDFATLAQREKDADRFTESYRKIAPSGGTYANEAYAGTRDWQHAFWGSHYERLLSIKMKVDPYGVLYCRSCVGSEYFTDNAGQLCYQNTTAQAVDSLAALLATAPKPAPAAPAPPPPPPAAVPPPPPVAIPPPPPQAPAPPPVAPLAPAPVPPKAAPIPAPAPPPASPPAPVAKSS